MTAIKATLITKSDFMGNINVNHIWLQDHGRMYYAQYESAPFIVYKKKGERKFRQLVFSYKPYVVLLKGWVDLKSQDMFGPVKTSKETGLKYQESEYASFDDRWQEDFENQTDLSKFKIIADYRGVNSHERLTKIDKYKAENALSEAVGPVDVFFANIIRDGGKKLEMRYRSVYDNYKVVKTAMIDENYNIVG